MEVDYKPLKNFEGFIKIKMPRYKERIEMIKKMNIKPKQSEDNVEVETENSGFDSALFMADMIQNYILNIDVTHIETKTHITTLEHLECYKEGVELINEVSSVLFNGLSLGNA